MLGGVSKGRTACAHDRTVICEVRSSDGNASLERAGICRIVEEEVESASQSCPSLVLLCWW